MMMKDYYPQVLKIIGYGTRAKDAKVEVKRLRVERGTYQQCGGGRRVIRKKIKGD
jgi:hypothetical protein